MYLNVISLFSLWFLDSSSSHNNHNYSVFIIIMGLTVLSKQQFIWKIYYRAHLKIQGLDKMSLLNVYLLRCDNLD